MERKMHVDFNVGLIKVSDEESMLLSLNYYQRMLHRKGVTDASDWYQTKMFPSFEDIFSSLRTPLPLLVLALHYSSSISLTLLLH